MSYPSIMESGVDFSVATAEECETALMAAFKEDLPLGMAFLAELAARVRNGEERVLSVQDPNTPLGRQIIRLLGTDIARPLVERAHGVAYGLYNCCAVVAATGKKRLDMSPREQIMLQNGAITRANC